MAIPERFTSPRAWSKLVTMAVKRNGPDDKHRTEHRRTAESMKMVSLRAGKKPALTTKERDIVLLLAHGLKDKEIAQKMSISTVAVRDHLHKIFAKVGVSDRLELACYAFRHHL